ncbi:unnamed protein product [Moneuplotes crassus]|uniref:Uncharacterized protein n=1 Tax=Euplotes crassus TaxID=5936 RepID=A0AAD2D1P7_EUPCR|nr:unnamed protein product [Moneuplotes crassus]
MIIFLSSPIQGLGFSSSKSSETSGLINKLCNEHQILCRVLLFSDYIFQYNWDVFDIGEIHHLLMLLSVRNINERNKIILLYCDKARGGELQQAFVCLLYSHIFFLDICLNSIVKSNLNLLAFG